MTADEFRKLAPQLPRNPGKRAHGSSGFSSGGEDFRYARTGRRLGNGEIDARPAGIVPAQRLENISTGQWCVGTRRSNDHSAARRQKIQGTTRAEYGLAQHGTSETRKRARRRIIRLPPSRRRGSLASLSFSPKPASPASRRLRLGGKRKGGEDVSAFVTINLRVTGDSNACHCCGPSKRSFSRDFR